MEFQSKWKSEKEKSLYVPYGQPITTQRQFFYREYFKIVDEILKREDIYDLKVSGRVLEVGCGRGTLLQYLANETSLNTGDLYGVDNSEDALYLAAENLVPKVPVGNFFRREATDLPFSENQFDAVLSMGVIEHVDDYELFLKEQLRVLKKNGMIICFVIPNKSSIQDINIFGKDHYHRTDVGLDIYEAKLVELGAGKVEYEWVNPYPIFTPIPQFLESPITWVYRQIYKLIGFKGSEQLCQTAILIAQKY